MFFHHTRHDGSCRKISKESLPHHLYSPPSGILLENNAGIHTLFKFDPRHLLSFCTHISTIAPSLFPWFFKLATATSGKVCSSLPACLLHLKGKRSQLWMMTAKATLASSVLSNERFKFWNELDIKKKYHQLKKLFREIRTPFQLIYKTLLPFLPGLIKHALPQIQASTTIGHNFSLNLVSN